MTKEAWQAAGVHGIEMGVAGLLAEIASKGGVQAAVMGMDGVFQWSDLAAPALVFLYAALRGFRLYQHTPAWDGKDRRDSLPLVPVPEPIK